MKTTSTPTTQLSGMKAAVQRAVYTFGMKHLYRERERENVIRMKYAYVCGICVLCLCKPPPQKVTAAVYVWKTETMASFSLIFCFLCSYTMSPFLADTFPSSHFISGISFNLHLFFTTVQLASLKLAFAMGKLGECNGGWFCFDVMDVQIERTSSSFTGPNKLDNNPKAISQRRDEWHIRFLANAQSYIEGWKTCLFVCLVLSDLENLDIAATTVYYIHEPVLFHIHT